VRALPAELERVRHERGGVSEFEVVEEAEAEGVSGGGVSPSDRLHPLNGQMNAMRVRHYYDKLKLIIKTSAEEAAELDRRWGTRAVTHAHPYSDCRKEKLFMACVITKKQLFSRHFSYFFIFSALSSSLFWVAPLSLFRALSLDLICGAHFSCECGDCFV
jgi:hypothetical protein